MAVNCSKWNFYLWIFFTIGETKEQMLETKELILKEQF